MARRGSREMACYKLRARRIGEASHPGPSAWKCPSCQLALRGDQVVPGDQCGICGGAPTPGGRGFRCDTCAVSMCADCVRGSQQAAETAVDSGSAADDCFLAANVEGIAGEAEACAVAPPPKRTGLLLQMTAPSPNAIPPDRCRLPSAHRLRILLCQQDASCDASCGVLGVNFKVPPSPASCFT